MMSRQTGTVCVKTQLGCKVLERKFRQTIHFHMIPVASNKNEMFRSSRINSRIETLPFTLTSFIYYSFLFRCSMQSSICAILKYSHSETVIEDVFHFFVLTKGKNSDMHLHLHTFVCKCDLKRHSFIAHHLTAITYTLWLWVWAHNYAYRFFLFSLLLLLR